jgi:serine protein kinase
LDDSKKQNEWDELVDPDEALMRSVEEKVEITSTGKDSIRQEIYRKMLKSKNEEGKYNWQSHPKLKEALQKQLFEERSDTIRLTVSTRNPEPEALKKLNAVINALVEHHGYTVDSANELLRYVNNIMSRTK